MDNVILNYYSKITGLNVSRETCNELESLISMILEKNKQINIISKKTCEKDALRERHIILNTEVIQKDICKLNNIETGTVMSRAFKPLPIILNLVSQNFKKYKNVILFMGGKGRKIFNDALQEWELDYEEKKSLTNNDSFILNIKNIKKKN